MTKQTKVQIEHIPTATIFECAAQKISMSVWSGLILCSFLAGIFSLTGCESSSSSTGDNDSSGANVKVAYQGMAYSIESGSLGWDNYLHAVGVSDLTFFNDGTFSAWISARTILPLWPGTMTAPTTEFTENKRYDGTYTFDGESFTGDGERHDGWGARLKFTLRVNESLDIIGGRFTDPDTHDSKDGSCRYFHFTQKTPAFVPPLFDLLVVELSGGKPIAGAHVSIEVTNHSMGADGRVVRDSIFKGSGRTDTRGMVHIGSVGDAVPFTVNRRHFYEFTDYYWLQANQYSGYNLNVTIDAPGFYSINERFLDKIDCAHTYYRATRLNRRTNY